MSNMTRIKVLKSGYTDTFERLVNAFLDTLKYDPVKMTFSNSFRVECDDYDDIVGYQPVYIAVIEYVSNPENDKAVKEFDEMYDYEV